MNNISGLHHTSQHSFSNISGLALMGKHENKHNFHSHHSPSETNGIKDLMSPSMSSGRNIGDNNIGSAMVKEEPEPEFYETICNWVGCDRGDLQSQDALVKVRTLK